MNQTKSKFGASCIIGLITFAMILILNNVLNRMIQDFLLQIGFPVFSYWFIIDAFIDMGAVVLSLLVYTKLVSKSKMAVGTSFLAGLCFAIVILLINRVLSPLTYRLAYSNLINYFLNFTIGTVTGLVFLSVTDKKEFVPVQTVPGNVVSFPSGQPVQPYTQPNAFIQNQAAQPYTQPNPYMQNQPIPGQPVQPYAQQPANMDALSVAILNALRPHLKAPMTAVLCPREQMMITTDNNGNYEIRGIVNSQNSYGAMIATDFSVKASFYNNAWYISNVSVGVQAAKNFAKNFASNYIAISIFVAVMGLLSYLILTLAIG